MIIREHIFHIAIPAKDLKDSMEFYSKFSSVGRHSDQYSIVNFFNHQVVLHLSDETPEEPKMYPRHFGLVFKSEKDFYSMYGLVLSQGIKPWREMFVRYAETDSEHSSFFLCDPSNNLIEFKFYKNPTARFQ